MIPQIQVIGVTGIPEVKRGDDLAALIVKAVRDQGTPLEAGDILIVTQKIVSKAEGRIVDLNEIEPSALALQFAKDNDRDPRQVELIFRESRRVVKMDKGNIIAETKHGFVCAASGVDESNVPGEDMASLLPEDPDASARRIRDGVRKALNIPVAVIISDTWGRPWREGAINVAIGIAGINPLKDYKGTYDASGRILRITTIATADEIASTAELVTAKAINVPVAIVRGFHYETDRDSVKVLLRDPSMDLFR